MPWARHHINDPLTRRRPIFDHKRRYHDHPRHYFDLDRTRERLWKLPDYYDGLEHPHHPESPHHQALCVRMDFAFTGRGRDVRQTVYALPLPVRNSEEK